MILDYEVEMRARNSFAKLGERESDELRQAVMDLVQGAVSPDAENGPVALDAAAEVLLMGLEAEFCSRFPDLSEKSAAMLDVEKIWYFCSVASPEFQGRERDGFDAVFYLVRTGNYGHLWDIGVSAGIDDAICAYVRGIPVDDIVS